jgi:hypothetical protein
MRFTAILILALSLALAAGACKEGREYAQTVAGGMDKARETEMRATFHGLAETIETYQIHEGRYPDRLEDIPDVASGRFRTDDAWGNAMRYTKTESGYDVISAGMDENFGTEDDLVLRDGQVP